MPPQRRLPPRSQDLAALAQAIEGLIADDPRLSLKIVAKGSGLNERQMSQYVRGQGNPTYTTLLKLAEKGLQVPLPVLVQRARDLRTRRDAHNGR